MSHRQLERSQYAAYWREAVRSKVPDPHFAQTETGTVKPHLVDGTAFGHHVSAVLMPGSGVRHWIFSGQANRDRFINAYRQVGAKPCGNPLS